MSLFNQTDPANNNATMLNPMNVKWFYETLAMGDKQTNDILARFGFLTTESLTCFVNYANNLQALSFPNQPDGTLIQRAIQLSFADIESILPNQLATRTMASYNVANNLTCASYISPVAATPIQTQFICDTHDFADNIEMLQSFVNSTWYGDYYKA
jgi:hypothetical protein